ncbi:MAG: ergothioneine biosynthesis protein EgtB [Oligoflexales bacterium]|nr:ergothioneine biosynthesis protein EgtB [Oligoflexales bacterium]
MIASFYVLLKIRGKALIPKQAQDKYHTVRQVSLQLCEPLQHEDYNLQCMEDASPPKWHLAHTTWFFEQFILLPYKKDYKVFSESFHFLFNSYYETAGSLYPRPKRGLIARPSLDAVLRYRTYVDDHMKELLQVGNHPNAQKIGAITEIGLHHEQQHQELLLTDTKYNFFCQYEKPEYQSASKDKKNSQSPKPVWIEVEEGVHQVGHDAKSGFAYDNESAPHKVYINPVSLSSHLSTNGDFAEFIDAGGYQRVELWLSEGWSFIKQNNIEHPLYWQKIGEDWYEFTLSGLCLLDLNAPVCHLSYFEADAFANWKNCRLPTEFEWEVASKELSITGNFLETHNLHPQPAPAQPTASGSFAQIFGDVWEWTQSSYAPYPNFKSLLGSLGEYNGKFMCNQYTLRGGSCVTPESHIRKTYRNFFSPHSRWQFTGIRLAKDD